jgi:hypothetical protein
MIHDDYLFPPDRSSTFGGLGSTNQYASSIIEMYTGRAVPSAAETQALANSIGNSITYEELRDYINAAILRGEYVRHPATGRRVSKWSADMAYDPSSGEQLFPNRPEDSSRDIDVSAVVEAANQAMIAVEQQVAATQQINREYVAQIAAESAAAAARAQTEALAELEAQRQAAIQAAADRAAADMAAQQAAAAAESARKAAESTARIQSGNLTADEFKYMMTFDFPDATVATKRGLAYYFEHKDKISPDQLVSMWNYAFGSNFTTKDLNNALVSYGFNEPDRIVEPDYVLPKQPTTGTANTALPLILAAAAAYFIGG